MSDQAIEQEIQAKGLTAPRVTPTDITANIAGEHYFTAQEGLWGAHPGFEPIIAPNPALSLLTFCVLVLRNGFTVTGESACASPENFNAEIGRKIARDNAINKVWPLMGYALKERLFEASNAQPALESALMPHQQRVLVEKTDLDEKIEKLNLFLCSPKLHALPPAEQFRLQDQVAAMQAYSAILSQRIVAFPAALV